ncbi:MAG: hypothetical protein QOF01_4791 [Thermomicrobiales bacterium]|jgi:hypothetical protein|nr:hypothetical protein [Thermomicrobiales bacterium]
MDDTELRELQDPDTWDFDQAEEHRPTERARAVVSVAFQRDDYDAVSEAARDEGMKVSEFIRDAALARAAYLPRHTRVVSTSGRSNFGGIGSNVTVTWARAPRLRRFGRGKTRVYQTASR